MLEKVVRLAHVASILNRGIALTLVFSLFASTPGYATSLHLQHNNQNINALSFTGNLSLKHENKITGLIAHNKKTQRNESIEKLLIHTKTLSMIDKVLHINSYFNNFKNKTDIELWGLKEYWATPHELFVQNAGDCEDIAVAKYHYLILSGIDENNLRLAYVKVYKKQTSSIENHLVLLYYDNTLNQEFVLDNIVRTIISTKLRGDLNYQFAFNRNNVWAMNKSISTAQIRRSGIFQSWKNVLKRIE